MKFIQWINNKIFGEKWKNVPPLGSAPEKNRIVKVKVFCRGQKKYITTVGKWNGRNDWVLHHPKDSDIVHIPIQWKNIC